METESTVLQRFASKGPQVPQPPVAPTSPSTPVTSKPELAKTPHDIKKLSAPLVDRGIDVTRRDKRFDATAAEWAEYGGHGDIARFLGEAERQASG